MASSMAHTGTASGGGRNGVSHGADAAGPVDTSSWSFFGRGSSRPTPILVGPVVGAVTEKTARVLIEVESTMAVSMEAFMDGDSVCSVKQEVRGKTPTVFKLRNFSAGRRVRVVVSIGQFGQEREARFTTTSDKNQWKIAATSCNCHTHIEELKLWERLSRVMGNVDCVLHLGDQIYADEDFSAKHDGGIRFESAWVRCLTLVKDLDRNEWSARRPELLEFYRKTYRKTWNMPAVATVLASAANYMICDDHEVVDDLGDEPEHTDPSTPESYVARVAYQAYCEYQRQLLADHDVTDFNVKAYYGFRLSPKVGFFMTDNRVERSIHRECRPAEDWKDRDFLGPAQWDRVLQAFKTDFADCDTVLFGAPTPLVFISQAATGLAERVIDDARGTWGHKNFKTEQKAMCTLLSDWQSAKPNRAVVTLAGDVHIGGFTDSWMCASAIGNTPEKDIDGVKSKLMMGVMHADEHLFKFKVKHHDWIFGPNYGMVDIQLKHGKRPDITLTLVPHKGTPEIRNLELGQAKVSVKDSDQSAASRSAHASAQVMAVPPDGFDKKKPKRLCGCSIM